jgi:hypothetical protein
MISRVGSRVRALLKGVCHRGVQLDAAPAVGCRIVSFEAFRRGGDFFLRLAESDAGLKPHVGFDPARAAIFQLVAATFKGFFHGCGNPELHGPAHKGSIKTWRRDTDDGVNHTIEALRFADDLRIALESALP